MTTPLSVLPADATLLLMLNTKAWTIDHHDFRVLNKIWNQTPHPHHLVGFLSTPDPRTDVVQYARVLRTDPSLVVGLYPLFSEEFLFADTEPVRHVALQAKETHR